MIWQVRDFMLLCQSVHDTIKQNRRVQERENRCGK